MAYTNDPVNEPTDAVRLLIGDTGSSPDITDEGIEYFLAEGGNNVLRAAILAAESLAATYAGKAEERRVGPLWLRSFSDKSTKYLGIAKALRARLARTVGRPYAGGISVMDKNEQIQDTDRVRPAFRRQQMSYPSSETQNMSPEEIVSPDYLP